MITAVQNASPGEFLLGGIILVSLLLTALYFFQRSLRHARLIEDTPTSRIRSAAQGYVELEGRGKLLPGEPVVSPLSHKPCVWWEYRVIETRHHHNSRSGPSRRVIASDRSDALFLLNDGTGECIIDPDGAEIRHSVQHHWHGNSAWPKAGPKHSVFRLFARYRYEERLIRVGDPLYALGLFRTQTTVTGHFDEQAELNELLREWKQDQALLHQRFDVNRDGRIDATEWEAARRVALKQVRQSQLEQDLPTGLHVLSRPKDGRPFLLSGIAQHQLVARHRWLTAGAIIGFLGLIVAIVWAASVRANSGLIS